MATSVPTRLSTSASFPMFATSRRGGSMRSTCSTSSSRDRVESLADEPSFCGSSSSSFEIDWCDSDDEDRSASEQATPSSEPKIRRTSDGDRLKTLTTAQPPSQMHAQPQRAPIVCDALSFVMRKLAKCLDAQREQNEKLSKTDLIVPPTLLLDVARRVVKDAADEPAGLRGCYLTVSLQPACGQAHDPPVSLGSIKLSPKIISTFEMRLVLQEMRNVSAAIWCKARLFELGLLSKRPVPLSCVFKLEKIDLYM